MQCLYWGRGYFPEVFAAASCPLQNSKQPNRTGGGGKYELDHWWIVSDSTRLNTCSTEISTSRWLLEDAKTITSDSSGGSQAYL